VIEFHQFWLIFGVGVQPFNDYLFLLILIIFQLHQMDEFT